MKERVFSEAFEWGWNHDGNKAWGLWEHDVSSQLGDVSNPPSPQPLVGGLRRVSEL